MGYVTMYGKGFRRARYEASDRLSRPELCDVKVASRDIGITAGYLYKLENDEQKPSLDLVEKMAAVYNVLPGDLLPATTLRSPEIDRIVAPLMSLPQATRSRFIVQMAAFARILAGEIAAQQIDMELRNEAYDDQPPQEMDEARGMVVSRPRVDGHVRSKAPATAMQPKPNRKTR